MKTLLMVAIITGILVLGIVTAFTLNINAEVVKEDPESTVSFCKNSCSTDGLSCGNPSCAIKKASTCNCNK